MNQAGTRLKCATCGGEIVVTKAGEGTVGCCGSTMGPR